MIETRHGLESNPVPTSFFAHTRAMMAIKQKKDVGTGLDSRPCLVSIIFSDLPSLHTLHFIEMIFIGERERANLVVQLAAIFLYIYI